MKVKNKRVGCGERKKDRDDLFSMRCGEFGILPEYPNKDGKLPIKYPSLTSGKKSQLDPYMKIKLETETLGKNKTA